MSHTLHRVSCKAILFDETGQHVLVTNLGHIGYGLPGGHIEQGELPDDTIVRELHEEAGLTGLNLRHFDFSWHHEGKLVLYYIGQIAHDTQFAPQIDEVVSLDWVEVVRVKDETLQLGIYADMIIAAHQSSRLRINSR